MKQTELTQPQPIAGVFHHHSVIPSGSDERLYSGLSTNHAIRSDAGEWLIPTKAALRALQSANGGRFPHKNMPLSVEDHIPATDTLPARATKLAYIY